MIIHRAALDFPLWYMGSLFLLAVALYGHFHLVLGIDKNHPLRAPIVITSGMGWVGLAIISKMALFPQLHILSWMPFTHMGSAFALMILWPVALWQIKTACGKHPWGIVACFIALAVFGLPLVSVMYSH